jgi:hypothetical protein
MFRPDISNEFRALAGKALSDNGRRILVELLGYFTTNRILDTRSKYAADTPGK